MSAGCGDQGSSLCMIYSFTQTQGGHRQATMPTSQNGYGGRDQESKVVTSYSCNVFSYSGGYQMWTLHSLGRAREYPSPLKSITEDLCKWGILQASQGSSPWLRPPRGWVLWMTAIKAERLPTAHSSLHVHTEKPARPQARRWGRGNAFIPPRQEWNVLAET